MTEIKMQTILQLPIHINGELDDDVSNTMLLHFICNRMLLPHSMYYQDGEVAYSSTNVIGRVMVCASCLYVTFTMLIVVSVLSCHQFLQEASINAWSHD